MQSDFISLDVPSTSAEVKDMPERFQHLLQKKASPEVSKLRPFLSSCLMLIQDKDAIAELQAMIDDIPIEPQIEKKVNQVRWKCKAGSELRMNAQIGDYDMDYIILDMGSDVNILNRQMWESMGNLCLDWSPIQLRLSNQAKLLPIGRLSNVIVDVEGLHTYADFEVIKIVDDTNIYPHC